MNHRDAMARKIALLRSTGAAEALERRWEEADEDPPYATYTVLEIADGAEPSRAWPGGLGDFYRLTSAASFGGVDVRPEDQVTASRPVDADGEPIDDRTWLRIGDIGYEDALLMDEASGEVIVYVNSYFKYGWDSPVVLTCADVPEFIDTVALGPRHKEIRGPVDRQREPWWEADPWYAYLVESGLIEEREAQ
ncbi:hypothetical protein [Glycomyces arizonensis]|uniref:hypothetical protein n=1 Tax=Glycomyces arizonensis TaxID=256035 RepID=UPI0004034CA5|nr:hypothetical protein [Glycomyces arizonensis]